MLTQEELDNKYDIIFEVIEEFIGGVGKGVSEFFNSDEFKIDLKERLKERGVEIKFKDDKKTKLIGNDKVKIEMDKYEVYFTEELHETIKKDLVIV